MATQRQYRIRPLSEYTGGKPPLPAPTYLFPAWDEARANSIGFIDYLNFILQFSPVVAARRPRWTALPRSASVRGGAFDAAALDPTIRDAIEAGIKEGAAKLQAELAKTTSSVDLFGTRAFLGEDYVMRRAVGAAIGIYGNSKRRRTTRPTTGCRQAASRRRQELRPALLEGPGAAGQVLLVA